MSKGLGTQESEAPGGRKQPWSSFSYFPKTYYSVIREPKQFLIPQEFATKLCKRTHESL